MPIQIKLLLFLETKSFEPVVWSHQPSIDVRVVCDTNGDLHGMVSQGKFRED
jgi:two-component system NtrC family response regulator